MANKLLLVERAVPHIDGTARVQTVAYETNARFYAVLKAFESQTGLPILLNTSFNVKGQPIVCTPAEAIEQAREFQNKASFYLDYVYSENSYGFHAPAYIQRILADSLDASRKGQLVLSGVDITTLEPSDISAENEKKSEERGA